MKILLSSSFLIYEPTGASEGLTIWGGGRHISIKESFWIWGYMCTPIIPGVHPRYQRLWPSAAQSDNSSKVCAMCFSPYALYYISGPKEGLNIWRVEVCRSFFVIIYPLDWNRLNVCQNFGRAIAPLPPIFTALHMYVRSRAMIKSGPKLGLPKPRNFFIF